MRRWFVTVSAAAALAFTAASATAQSPCGDQVQVRENESLSDIARRCNVTESKILDLNPDIQGAVDLRAGMKLSLAAPPPAETAARAREAAQSFLQRLKGYAREAGRSLESATETVTGSVQDFLARNPDLHQSVRRLGQKLNIPGMEKVEAQVSLSVRKGPPGTPVTLSAIGLPANQRVEIGGGPPDGDYDILASALTSAEGTLQVTVQVPEQADPHKDFIFVVAAPEIDLAARSATFDVVERTAAAPPQ